MKNVVIVSAKRTPIGKSFKGFLSKERSDETGGYLLKKMVDELNIDKNEIEDVITGCAMPEGEQGLNISRNISLLAQLPVSVAGITVNRFCGSSMSALHYAVHNIMCNYGEIFAVMGVEFMTKIPMGGFNPNPSPKLFKEMPEAYISMGLTAENLAKKYNIKREEQDEFALNSHLKAIKATNENKFFDEILPIKVLLNNKKEIITKDESIREDISFENLSKLKPAFELNGTVTAGNSSPLSDGVSGLIVMSEEKAIKYNLKPLAKVISTAVCGVEPELMGIGPVKAVQKALLRANLTINDIDCFEVNEAFASQTLAVIKELNIDVNKVNLNGGAIALGHPLGSSGSRIIGTLINVLKQNNKKYGVATMCIGGGQGIATVIEAL